MDFARPIGIGPHFSVHVVTDKEVLLLSEQRSYRLQGKLYVALMPFLDGRRTGEEIICAFAGRISRERLRKVLADLVEKNYACHLDSAAPTERQALWAEFGLVPAEAERNLLGRAVAITATTDRGPAAEAARLLRQALIDSGVSVAGGEAANLVVVSVDDYLTPELEGVNARMRKEGRSWIPFKGAGAAPMLGPLFHPHAAPCWRCLAAAMIENRPGDTVIDNGGVASRPARGFTVATLGLAATFSALEIARSLAQPAPSSLERNVLALDLKTRSLREHFVRAQTNCPVCGAAHDPATSLQRSQAPLRLQSRPLSSQVDGGWRSLTAAQVVQRLDRYVSPLTGLISGLQDFSLGDGLPVFTARQAGPLTVNARANRLIGRPSGAAGKGMSNDQAKASCLAEAVERYLGHFTGREPRLRATWETVKGSAPHPHDLLNFSERQYDNRRTWNESHTAYHQVPERFDERREIEWTPAWSVSRDRLRWLPTRFCYYAYVDSAVPGQDDNKFCSANSNGCASGSTLEEAILQGFFELVERDACAAWWYNRLRRPAFDLEGLADPFVRKVETHCHEQRRRLHVIDVTNDLGIPTAIALSFDEAEGNGIVLGLGAHLDVEVAISRALSELNQALALETPASKRGEAVRRDASYEHWLKNHTVRTDPYCLPAGSVSAGRYDRPRFGDLKHAVEHCADIVESRGLELIVLDCSRPEIEFAAARVVVPGMRHFWARLGKGRLYQAPVEMGLLSQPLREDELNPVAFPF